MKRLFLFAAVPVTFYIYHPVLSAYFRELDTSKKCPACLNNGQKRIIDCLLSGKFKSGDFSCGNFINHLAGLCRRSKTISNFLSAGNNL